MKHREKKHFGESTRYKSSEVRSKQDRVLSSVTVFSGFQEIKIDRDGDGTADLWEITKNNKTIFASNPVGGQFLNLEFRDKKSTGLQKTNFQFDAMKNNYRLVSSSLIPYRLFRADDIRTGLRCDLKNTLRLETFSRVLTRIANETQKSAELSIACEMKVMQPLFFDSSCTKNPYFKADLDNISAALARIMTSVGSGQPSANSRYLACLDDNGLPEHAARIQAFISGKFRDAASTMESVLSPSELAEVMKAKAGNCEVRPAILAKMQVPLREDVRLFSCRKDLKRPTDRAAFNDAVDSEQIILMKNSADLTAMMRGYDAASSAASTLFHELAHASGIEAEPLTRVIESCCAGNANNEINPGSCGALATDVRARATSQSVGTMLAAGSYQESSLDVLYDLNIRLNDSTKADTLMNSFKAYVAERRSEDITARAQLKDSRGNSCAGRDVAEECDKLAADLLNDRWKKYVGEFFKPNSGRCQNLLVGTGTTRKESSEICGTFKPRFEKMVTRTDPRELNLNISATLASASVIESPEFKAMMKAQNEKIRDYLAGEVLSSANASAVTTSDNTAPVGGNDNGEQNVNANQRASGMTPASDSGLIAAARTDALPGTVPTLAAGTNLTIPSSAAQSERRVNVAAVSSAGASPIAMENIGRARTNRSDGFTSSVRRSETLFRSMQMVTDRATQVMLPRAMASSLPMTLPGNLLAPFAASLPAPESLREISRARSNLGEPAANRETSARINAAVQNELRDQPSLAVNNLAESVSPRSVSAAQSIASSGGGSAAPSLASGSKGRVTRNLSSVNGSGRETGSRFATEPSFSSVQSAQNVLGGNYENLTPYFERTRFRAQLIDLKIMIEDKKGRSYGCDSQQNACTPEWVFRYCEKRNRLALPGGC